MPEFIETTIDKFTFRVATDRLYSPNGLWVLPLSEEQNRVRIGVTDYLQQHNGDVAFISVKPPGTTLVADADLAELETVKMTFTVPSPISGTVVETNRALEMTPEIVNQDPYGQGWLALIDVTGWDTEKPRLLDAQAYLSVMRAEAEQETKGQ